MPDDAVCPRILVFLLTKRKCCLCARNTPTISPEIPAAWASARFKRRSIGQTFFTRHSHEPRSTSAPSSMSPLIPEKGSTKRIFAGSCVLGTSATIRVESRGASTGSQASPPQVLRFRQWKESVARLGFPASDSFRLQTGFVSSCLLTPDS